MGDKKLSKSALERELQKNRKHFKEECYKICMKILVEHSILVLSKFDIKVQLKNSNRYISIKRYGAYLNIAIFTSGDIDITLDEMMHGEYKERIFEFTTDTDEQNCFYDRFSFMLDFLFNYFFELGDSSFQDYMDYISKTSDIKKAHDMYFDELHQMEE